MASKKATPSEHQLHIARALDMVRALLMDVQDLARGVTSDDVIERIERMSAAFNKPKSLRQQRADIMRLLDSAKTAGLLGSLGDAWLGDPAHTALLRKLALAWADDRPGAKKTGSGSRSKYDLLSELLAAMNEPSKTTAVRLKKERYAKRIAPPR